MTSIPPTTREHIHTLLQTNVEAVGRALIVLRNRQTEMERAAGETIDRNGCGFSAFDAHILTSFADQWEAKGWLSPKQIALARRKLTKYENQLVKVARAKAGLPEEEPKVRKPRKSAPRCDVCGSKMVEDGKCDVCGSKMTNPEAAHTLEALLEHDEFEITLSDDAESLRKDSELIGLTELSMRTMVQSMVDDDERKMNELYAEFEQKGELEAYKQKMLRDGLLEAGIDPAELGL